MRLFLSQGLLMFLNVASCDTLLLFSFIFGNLVTLPLWVVAGVQDWKRNEVSGYVCFALMVVTGFHSLLFSGWLFWVINIACAFLAFREKEITLIGQADFIMFAHWVCIYNTIMGSGYGMFLIASSIFLGCLVGYCILYRDRNGGRWHPGKMVPLIPPYALSVFLTVLVQYPLSLSFFEIGW